MLNTNETQELPDEPTQVEFASAGGCDDDGGSKRKPRTAVGGDHEFRPNDRPNEESADVLGSILVGHDSILLCSTMPEDFDIAELGDNAVRMFRESEQVSEKLGLARVKQIACRTESGYLLMKDIAGGVFVTVVTGGNTSDLVELMHTGTQVEVSQNKRKGSAIGIIEHCLQFMRRLPALLKAAEKKVLSQ